MVKKLAIFLSAVLMIWLVPARAQAWDGADLWYANAAGQPPGGGGILGTGGARDYTITCANCHIESTGMIDAAADFQPALAMAGGQPVYSPGQMYQVTVNLIGEHLGLSNCDPNTANSNNMGATFEDANGKTVGILKGDYGSSDSCPATLPMTLPGPSFVVGDCHAVITTGGMQFPGRTSWTFSWTAPAAGTGTITMFYGVVDGNCDMKSLNDDVKLVSMPIGEAMAAVEKPHGKNVRFAWLGVLPALGVSLAIRRRRRATTDRARGAS